MTLPYPVPPAVQAEIDKLGGSYWGSTVSGATIVYVLEFLDAKGNAAHTSPRLTGYQLTRYVYEFNTPLSFLKWRMRLTLYWTYHGESRQLSVTFTVDDPFVTPKGSGSKVHINGRSKSISGAALSLRSTLVGGTKLPHPGNSGYSSSRPLRPNESVNSSMTRIGWLRSSFAAAWSTGSSTKTWVGRSRTWTGVRTPGFGGLTKWQLPVNPHTVAMRSTHNGPLITASNNVSTGSASGSLGLWTEFYTGASQPFHLAKAEAKALERLIEQALGERQNIAESLATLGQTRDMMIGNIQRISKSIIALKKGNLPKAVKELFGNHNPRYRRRGGPKRGGDLASNWLELQYGWKPLINDIHWAMQALSKVNLEESPVVRTATQAKVKQIVESKFYANITPSNTVPGGVKKLTTHSTCRMVIYWRITDPAISLLQQAGFTNPVSLAWELLPFSFVVDWFLPLGPYFEQLSAWHGVQFLRGATTKFTRQWTALALNYDRINPSNANQRDWGQGNYHDEWIILNRAKLTSFPAVSLPTLKNGLSSFSHIANGVALLRAIMK